MKKSGFKMRGMSFKEGQSPMRNINVQAFKAAPAGSSKEELLEIAEGFVEPLSEMELDYGGEFDYDSSYSETGVSEEEDLNEEEPKEPKEKKAKKENKKFNFKWPNIKWPKRKKTPGSFISLEDIKNMNKGAKFQEK